MRLISAEEPSVAKAIAAEGHDSEHTTTKGQAMNDQTNRDTDEGDVPERAAARRVVVAEARAADYLAAAAQADPLREKLADAMTPGCEVEFDPDEAERAGAFTEDALSEQDAADSGADLLAVGSAESRP